MKIALIDNMNNNFFALTRYFRDLGIEADLFLVQNKSHAHFCPDQDTWENLSGVGWIKEFPVSYHWSSYIKPIASLLNKEFCGYDKIIACGLALGLLMRAGIKVDLFIPFGSDLFHFPFPKSYKLGGFAGKINPLAIFYYYRAFWQIKAIRSARLIISNTNWKVAQDAIDSLSCKAVNLPRVMIYKKGAAGPRSDRFAWLCNHDFVVFSPARHLWKTNADPLPDFDVYGGAKRNDKLIRAFSRVVMKRLFKNPILVFCEYGADVAHSKTLINSLGLDSYVHWLPLLPRREVVQVITYATFVADQFREGMSATSSGTTNEALAFGTPVIANTDGAIFLRGDPYYGCPILQALTEDEIYEHFRLYSETPEDYKAIGLRSAEWFSANLGVGLARNYLELI